MERQTEISSLLALFCIVKVTASHMRRVGRVIKKKLFYTSFSKLQ
jgi:hypothetical protein